MSNTSRKLLAASEFFVAGTNFILAAIGFWEDSGLSLNIMLVVLGSAMIAYGWNNLNSINLENHPEPEAE